MTNGSQSRIPHQVFISFRGKDQRGKFVSTLKSALKKSNINVFVDEDDVRGSSLTTLFQRIRESTIALVVFTKNYPESEWCLNELVVIKKQMEKGSIVPFPIFYDVTAHSVKTLTRSILTALLKTEDEARKRVDRTSHKSILETEAKIWEWRQALISMSGRMGVSFKGGNDDEFSSRIVGDVEKLLDRISIEKPVIHPQETVMSFLKALKVKKPDLEDLIAKPTFNHSQSTDHWVFVDLSSLEDPILVQRLHERGQGGKLFLVLLGSLQLEDYNHEGFTFKPLLFPKKPQQFSGRKLIVSSQEIQDQSCTIPVQVTKSNDNLQNSPREDNNSNDPLTCFSFLCNIITRCAMMISPPPPKVFISSEKQLRQTLLSLLKKELESDGISVYLEDETKEKIKESSVVIVFFSVKSPESSQCLDELVEIKKLMDVGKIDPYPIFYKLKAETVTEIKGWFHKNFLKGADQVRKSVNRDNDNSILDTEARIYRWRQALSSVASRPGLSYNHSSDAVFFSEVVTKVKEKLVQLASRETPKNPVSYETNDHLTVEKPLLHGQEPAEASITTAKYLDDDLFYSLTSLLKALNLEISDFEGFREIHNGLVSLCLKGHSNLVFLNLNSLENLVRFKRSDTFELLKRSFSLNPHNVSRLEVPEPSLLLELESNQPQQGSDNTLIVSYQDHQILDDTNLATTMF